MTQDPSAATPVGPEPDLDVLAADAATLAQPVTAPQPYQGGKGSMPS